MEREEGEEIKDTILKPTTHIRSLLLGKGVVCQAQVQGDRGTDHREHLTPSLTGAEVPGTSLGHFRCSVTKNRF